MMLALALLGLAVLGLVPGVRDLLQRVAQRLVFLSMGAQSPGDLLSQLGEPLSLLAVGLLPPYLVLRVAQMVYRSRDHALWQRPGNWLPIRGRWLCYALLVLFGSPVLVAVILYSMRCLQGLGWWLLPPPRL